MRRLLIAINVPEETDPEQLARPQEDNVIHNPVRLRTLGPDHAGAVVDYARQFKAPAEADGDVAVLPGDQPGFLFGVLDFALDEGHAFDNACAQAIVDMEAGLR